MDSLIYDEEQIRKFYRNIVCADDYDESEFDFFVLTARKKYLNLNEVGLEGLDYGSILEKVKFKCNDEETFIKKLKKVDSCLRRYKSIYGVEMPLTSMVYYMSPNHLSQKDVYGEFKQEADFSKNKEKDINLTFYFEDAPHRTWIDLDMDLYSEKDIDYLEVKKGLDSIALSDNLYSIIKSYSGFHILLNSKELDKYNFNKVKALTVKDYVKKLKEYFNSHDLKIEELMVNLYCRVPIPGTLHGGRPVILYN